MPRPTYTLSQLDQFYKRIDLPQEHRHTPEAASLTYAFLTILQQHTLITLPFENLSLHYSRTPAIDLHPTSLFEKIVLNPENGRGGYCMELNTLFATVLRTLGFQVMSTGGRVSSQASPNGCSTNITSSESFYYGFAHMVNIVTISGKRYLVDVGFGAGGPICPLLLEDGTIYEEIGPARRSVRLRWGTVPDGEDSEAKVWHLEQRKTGTEHWTGLYCFPDRMEFSPADFEVLNCFASSSRKSFYVGEIVVVKFLPAYNGNDIVGEIVLVGNRLHRRFRGEKEELAVLTSEQDRLDALEGYFNIRLDEREQLGILGMGTMLEGG